MADYKSCAWYQNGTCIRYDKSGAPISCADCEDYERRTVFKVEELPENQEFISKRKVGQLQDEINKKIKDKLKVFDLLMYENLNEVVALIAQLDYESDIKKAVDMVSKCFHIDHEFLIKFVIDCKNNKSNRDPLALTIFNLCNKLGKDKPEHDAVEYKKIEITLKSGETITYSEGKWDDYAYDGKAVIVKHGGAWVAIYNFDDVYCVELKG